MSEKFIPPGYVDTPVSVTKEKIRTGTGNREFLHPVVCILSALSCNGADVTEFLNFIQNTSFSIYRSQHKL